MFHNCVLFILIQRPMDSDNDDVILIDDVDDTTIVEDTLPVGDASAPTPSEVAYLRLVTTLYGDELGAIHSTAVSQESIDILRMSVLSTLRTFEECGMKS